MTSDQPDPCADGQGGDCQAALLALYGYLDGQLTVERRIIIKAHIEYCSPCLQTFSFEAELRQVVSRRCTDEVPEALRMRIAEAIKGEINRGGSV